MISVNGTFFDEDTACLFLLEYVAESYVDDSAIFIFHCYLALYILKFIAKILKQYTDRTPSIFVI